MALALIGTYIPSETLYNYILNRNGASTYVYQFLRDKLRVNQPFEDYYPGVSPWVFHICAGLPPRVN